MLVWAWDGGPALFKNAFEQLRQPRIRLTIDPGGIAQKFQQPSRQVAGAPVGMAMSIVGPLEIDHDKVERIERVRPGTLSRQAEAKADLRVVQQRLCERDVLVICHDTKRI